MSKIRAKLAESRKAIVAAATPGLVLLVNDLTAEASTQASGWIAVAATLVLTWLVPNKAPEA
jgi:hypothetical protein